MRLGAMVFVETDDAVELARAHRLEGYRAAYCPRMASLDDLAATRRVEEAFRSEDVVIAEVGAWCNMIAPDLDGRRRYVDYVCKRLALADEVGALGCVNYAGSYDTESPYGPHPMNLSGECFDLIVTTVRGILNTVKPRRAKLMLEMMPWVFPDDADSYMRLIQAIDHPQFGVHLDPVNIITSPQRYFRNGDVIRECFAKLGPHIMSCHGKDVIMSKKFMVEIEEIAPGKGTLDYRTFLTELNKLPQDPPLMLEHLKTKEQYAEARDYVMGVAREQGLSFEL